MLLNKKGSTFHFFALGIALLLIISIVSGCAKKGAASTNDAVATYKGGQYSKAEFASFLGVTSFLYPQYATVQDNPEFKDYMLKQAVTLKILSERASDASKKDADTKVKDQMTQMKQYFDSQGKDALDKQLKASNITQKDIEDYIHRSLVAMTDTDSKVTDQQIKDTYDTNLKADPKAFDVATVSHILIALQDSTTGKDIRTKDEALNRAKEVKDKLDKGGDFGALAKEYSDDPGSKDNGGKYENEHLATSQWDPEFKKAAAELPVNKVSDPIETSFGYHIMLVNSRTSDTFDNVKETLKSQVAEGLINDFVTKELETTLEYKSNLPAPSPSAAPVPAVPAPAAPAASVQPSAPASPEKK
jgi:foldase protein PrsA